MSDFTVIRAVTETLRSILEAGITNSPDMQLNGVPIDLRSPKEMREDKNATGISLWLYRVVRDPDLLNRPPERISPTQVRRASLPVRLYYLVTPLVALPEDRQTLLGQWRNRMGTICGASCCRPTSVGRNTGATGGALLGERAVGVEDLRPT